MPASRRVWTGFWSSRSTAKNSPKRWRGLAPRHMLLPETKRSKPPQGHGFNHVVGAFLEDQRRARPRRQDIVFEVGEVGAFPDRNRGRGRFFVGQQRVAVKIRPGIVEGGITKRQEAADVPIAKHRLLRIDIDGEIEEV